MRGDIFFHAGVGMMLIKILLSTLLLASMLCAIANAQATNERAEGDEMALQERGRVRAPELEGGRGWLNTDKPLSLAALRGKVVLLDFWTYGCINCIHIIPELKKLERKYPNNLVVIGVHSAKFDNEKDEENIRRIILRYGVEHPVVNDADFEIWKSYAVRAWPTRVLIDPKGYVIGKVEGEGGDSALQRKISETIEEFRKRGELKEEPLKLSLERAKVGELPLAFPGKVLCDAKTKRLFIADSNHNRIVITNLDGALIETVGAGAAGRADGAFDRATFNRPQGMAYDAESDSLFVADTENHLIRRIDFKTRAVTTIAGTGEQLRSFMRADEEPPPNSALQTALSSPWDLKLIGENLFIAMAGVHQIWRMDLRRNSVGVFAGTGAEARYDNTRFDAAFAQPSGLATDGKFLYVADSESNVVRRIDLWGAKDKDAKQVKTLAGGDLFDFGDTDGRGDEARLQHPLGLAYHEGALFIADTYNHKIKRMNLETRTVETFAGTGKPGQADGDAPSFYEPGGLSVADGKLYVADTNNQAVRVVDLKTKSARTLRIEGLRPPMINAMNENSNDESAPAPNAEIFKLDAQRLQLANDAALVVDVALPAGYHLNPNAPQKLKATIEKGITNLNFGVKGNESHDSAFEFIGGQNLTVKSLPMRVPLRAIAAGAAELTIKLTIYFCREDNTGACRIKTLTWRVPVEVTKNANAPRELRLSAKVTE